jgi:hypothetical protein
MNLIGKTLMYWNFYRARLPKYKKKFTKSNSNAIKEGDSIGKLLRKSVTKNSLKGGQVGGKNKQFDFLLKQQN